MTQNRDKATSGGCDDGARLGFVAIYRLARPGLFIAASFFSAATHSPWTFGAAFALGLAGCLDALAFRSGGPS